MTEKGLKGYITIKIFDQDINLYNLLNSLTSDRKIIQYSPDFKEVSSYPFVKGNQQPELKAYETRFRVYLHVNLKESEKKHISEWEVSRVATISCFVEHMPAKDLPAGKDIFDYSTFLKNIRSLYVSLDDQNIKDLIKNEKEVLQAYVLHGEFNAPDLTRDTALLDIYSFVGYIIWLRVCKGIREHISQGKVGNQHKILQIRENNLVEDPETYSSEYLKLKSFIQTLQESKPDVSYDIVSIKLEKTPSKYGMFSLKDSPQEWVNFATDFRVDTKDMSASELEGVRRKIRNETIFTSQNEYFFQNNALYFSNLDDDPDSVFIEGNAVDFAEWGYRTSRSWAIMLTDMLCSLSETFLLHNEEIEKHVAENGKKSAELRILTQKAMQDFRSYYDVDILANSYYKESFEAAKEAFKINNYHTRLRERLELFSNFEIASESATLNRRIVYISVLFGVVTASIPLLQYLHIL